MDRITARIHWKNYLETVREGKEPMFSLDELAQHYKREQQTQKWRKSAEQRKSKAERRGVKPRRTFDRMSEHKARAIKRLASQGYKRTEIAEIIYVSYDKVDSVLRGLTWSHIK